MKWNTSVSSYLKGGHSRGRSPRHFAAKETEVRVALRLVGDGQKPLASPGHAGQHH